MGVLFCASGASALGFEVVWAAQLGRLLGGTTTAVAYVVALFMGGMGLGHAVAGRLTPRVTRPIAWYGIAEAGLAILALGVVYAIPALESRVSPTLGYVLVALLILPCTFLMGVTLPLLVHGSKGSTGSALGRLYALNTGGAVIGVLVTGMVLVGVVGLTTTAWILSGIGCLVAAIALMIDRARALPSVAAPRAPVERRAWLVIAAVFGFASIAEEVLWTRALTVHLNSSTYALSAILGVFLGGLALGAAAASRALRRGRPPIALFILSQVLAGVTVLMSPELLRVAELVMPGYVGVSRVGDIGGFTASIGRAIGRAVFGIGPAAFFLGLALPLATELHAGSTPARGAAAGRVIAANTIGAVLGSLGARFVLLPLVGVGNGLRAVVLLHAAVALVAVSVAWAPRIGGVSRRGWLLLSGALVLVTLLRAEAEPFVGRMVRTEEVIFVEEGVQDTTAVIEYEGGQRHIFSNGIAYAGDVPGARRYMRLLGHLPSLFARGQDRALVICAGTGMTAASVARHPFAEIDLVDISPVVHRTLPYFDHVNDRVYDDPRVHIHIIDGRIFAAHAPEHRYDVITLEPPPPRAAGVAALYSVEFYERVRELLASGGAFAQWLPLHGMTRAELAMLTRTFLDVFPEGELMQVSEVEAGLIAVVGNGASDETISERLTREDIRAHLDSIDVEDPRTLPTVQPEALAARIGPGPLVTDDHPRIEHYAAGLGEADDTEDAGRAFLVQVLGGTSE